MIKKLYHHLFIRPSYWLVIIYIASHLGYIHQTPYYFDEVHQKEPVYLTIDSIKKGGQLYAIFHIPKAGYERNRFWMPCETIFGTTHACQKYQQQSYQLQNLVYVVNPNTCQHSFSWVKRKTSQCLAYITNATFVDSNHSHFDFTLTPIQIAEQLTIDIRRRYQKMMWLGLIILGLIWAIRSNSKE